MIIRNNLFDATDHHSNPLNEQKVDSDCFGGCFNIESQVFRKRYSFYSCKSHDFQIFKVEKYQRNLLWAVHIRVQAESHFKASCSDRKKLSRTIHRKTFAKVLISIFHRLELFVTKVCWEMLLIYSSLFKRDLRNKQIQKKYSSSYCIPHFENKNWFNQLLM